MVVGKYLERFEENFISLILVVMTLLVFTEVILRFVFGIGVMWMEEVTLTLAAWFVLFGMSYGLKVGAHISVDAFVNILPNKTKRIVTGLALLLSLGYCGLLISGSFVYLSKMKMIALEMDDLPLQKWQVMSILVGGFVLLGYRLLGLLVGVVRGTVDGFKHTDEVKESLHLAEEVRAEVDAVFVEHNSEVAKGHSK
ncbi:MAG: C4-dicarboxylate transporter DctQ subunit [Pseudohongiellaceae bacterium]